MSLNKVLVGTSLALGALLVTQVVINNSKPLPHRYHASWINNANTAQEGVDQSDHVVGADVVSLAKGPDIVIATPAEPSGQDSIPTTVVTLSVTKKYKGNKSVGEIIHLLQTGSGSDAVISPAPPEADETLNIKSTSPVTGKNKRPDGQTKGSPPSSNSETRSTILEDDPPYQIGEKYILFLKNLDDGGGANPLLNAVPPGTTRALAPEGRYQVTKQDHLKPVTTKKGFAPKWQGKHKSELEAAIGGGNP